MQVPLQFTIRDIPHTKELEQHIQQKAEKLDQFSECIISCQVNIEQTKKHQNQGKLYDTHINLNLPGKELASTHNENENLYVSIRDAFDDMHMQLESYMEKSHSKIKNHSSKLSGKIVRLIDGETYGFIEGTDGTEYYFNADSVAHPRFEHLSVGDAVYFIEHVGKEGLQAHRVSAHKHECF
ncbi:MAG: HPF/RaiA family ribosome-associated protein [Gammaproteobacteria bacterium]|nr:HPF/RaiA family ribosome-associated protein [Gammaproteobacteria bacterium]MCH9716235.1 HPF/RaiA family ribosome-associated protein [Gammaproteobacteria bacterium]MCH9744403.1 HPF/RaiA family ribosome-associated protein [Gammaproteobacteria bacterium]